MRKAPTSDDVARQAGVSRATVSYVLNGRKNATVPDETRRRVLAAAQEIGYRPHRGARALARGRTQQIGLLLPRLSTPFYAQFAEQIQRLAVDQGFEAIILSGAAYQNIDRLLEWPVDGVLMVDPPNELRAVLARDAISVPWVSVGHYHSDAVDFVGVDLYAGAESAVRHLIDTGRTRIALGVYAVADHVGDSRTDAYLSVMRDAGMKPEKILVPLASRRSAQEAFAASVAAGSPPDGLFCWDDELALGVYRGCREASLSIPGEIALVGCDGIDDTLYLDTQLSTVIQPLEEVCRTSWEFLQRRMASPDIPLQQTILQPTLAIRESS